MKANTKPTSTQAQCQLEDEETVSTPTPNLRQLVDATIARARTKTRDELVSLVLYVGPEEADILLSYSTGNRPENPRDIARYARDMLTRTSTGGWAWDEKCDANPILFTISGRAGNLHHRMKAVRKCRRVVRFVASFGNSERSVSIVDEIVPRQMHHRFALEGRHVPPKIIAAVRTCMRLEGTGTGKYSMNAIDEAMTRYARSIEVLKPLFSTKFPASMWGAVLYAHPYRPTAIEEMFRDFVRGEGVTGPAFTLREFINNQRKGSNTGGESMMRISLRTLYAIRAFVEDRPLTRFSVREDEKILEWFATKLRKRNRSLELEDIVHTH